jgi:uncharacterized protein YcfJ
MKNFKFTAVVVALVFGLSSCATNKSRDQVSSESNSNECNAAVAGVAGAIVGGLLAGGKNRVKGAAAGAAIGAFACFAINANSRQTKTASQVETDYKSTRGGLPSSPRVVAYNTSIAPGQVIRPGADVSVTSNIEVVSGQKIPVRDVKEEIVLLDPKGEEFKRKTKAVGENGAPGSGAYQNTFAFKMPTSAPQGVYTVKTQVYLNGNVAKQSENHVQLVMLGDKMIVASLN